MFSFVIYFLSSDLSAVILCAVGGTGGGRSSQVLTPPMVGQLHPGTTRGLLQLTEVPKHKQRSGSGLLQLTQVPEQEQRSGSGLLQLTEVPKQEQRSGSGLLQLTEVPEQELRSGSGSNS